MTRRSALAALALALALLACKNKRDEVPNPATSKYPATEDGVRQLLTDLRAGDARAKTRELKPVSADYKAVYADDAVAAKAAAGYDKLWATDPKAVIEADPAFSEIKVWKATTEDFQKWTEHVDKNFPGGYRRVAGMLKPGVTVYRWNFVKPGESGGVPFDGLIHVNGRWAWFPKPWRIIAVPEKAGSNE